MLSDFLRCYLLHWHSADNSAGNRCRTNINFDYFLLGHSSADGDWNQFGGFAYTRFAGR